MKAVPKIYTYEDFAHIEPQANWTPFDYLASVASAVHKLEQKKPAVNEEHDDREQRVEQSSKKQEKLPENLEIPNPFRKAIMDLCSRVGKNLSGEIELVIEKSLTKTDLDDHQDRMSIPASQIVARNFLSREEKEHLCVRNVKNKLQCIKATIIEPRLESEPMRTVDLRRWELKATSVSYVLSGKWKHIAKRNQLKEGMVIQLWCFRMEGELGFALVNKHSIQKDDALVESSPKKDSGGESVID